MNNILLKIYEMVVRSGVCPDTPLCAWSEIIPFCHNKGYLYALYEKDELASVVCAYRIPKFSDDYIDRYPEKEEGNILYVPWTVSHSRSITSLLFMFKKYMKSHDIREIAYYRRNSSTDLKRIKLNVTPQKSLAS